MTRIVYAAPHYTPPPGVIVLPLEAHPAIVEDATIGQRQSKTAGKIRIDRPPTALVTSIMAWLKANPHGGTTGEIARALGVSQSSTIRNAVIRHPELFEEIGERQYDKWHTGSVWGLVEGN